MAMVMDFDSSNITCKNNNSTTTVDEIQDWNSISPVVDWESLSSELFIDPMIEEKASSDQFPGEILIEEYNSMSQEYNTLAKDDRVHDDDSDSKVLKLIHLLIAAAEAFSGSTKSGELTKVILVRLSELVSPHHGSNMERLAAYFTYALQGLLDGPGCDNTRMKKDRRRSDDDVITAFQLLQDTSPYVKFGHFTANQAILEAVAGNRRVHIVDYDIMEGVQWASLMQALVSRKDQLSGPHLQITAVTRGGGNRWSPLGSVQETGRRLSAFAASLGLPFSFHQCKLDHDEKFRPEALKLAKGEALITNCVLHLPNFSYRAQDSIASFLSGMRTLGPRLVALVEEEVGPMGAGGFVGRFTDALHQYSTVYDSLEAGFPMQRQARTLVERVFLGPQIVESLTRIYQQAHGDGDGCSWARWMGSVGFQPVEMSYANHCQAKLLLGLYNDGYKVEQLCGNKLVLGWKLRRLFSASVWTSQDNNL